MLSFRKKMELEEFLLGFATQILLTEDYAAIRADEIYYVKEDQVVSLSTHALQDGIKKERLWWHDVKDSNFTNFADKVLNSLRNYDALPDKGLFGLPKPVRQVDTKIGVCDTKEYKGWVIALQESRNEAKTLDSCHVVTILNKHSKTMVLKAPLFAKADLYVVNIDKAVTVVPQEDLLKKELSDITSKLKELDDKHDDMYLDMEYEEDAKLKLKKKKEYESLIRQIEQLKNRKSKLEKTVQESSVDIYVVMNESTQEQIHIIMI